MLFGPIVLPAIEGIVVVIVVAGEAGADGNRADVGVNGAGGAAAAAEVLLERHRDRRRGVGERIKGDRHLFAGEAAHALDPLADEAVVVGAGDRDDDEPVKPARVAGDIGLPRVNACRLTA